MALTNLVLLFSCMALCHCLLMQQPSFYSNDDLYRMIEEMNNTISHMETTMSQMETTISKQNTVIAGLRDEKYVLNVGFHAKLSHSISNLGDDQAIEFDQVITNVGYSYDPRHGHLTAPVSGMYLISTSVMSTHGHHLYCEVVKNGKVLSRLYGGAEDYQADTQTFVVELQSGDMVWVRHSSGKPNELLNGYNSYFSGFLISTL